MIKISRRLPGIILAIIICVSMAFAISALASESYAASSTYKLDPVKIKTSVMVGDTVKVKVKLTDSKSKKNMKDVKFSWVYDKDALEIKDANGKDTARGTVVTFRIKRLSNAETAFTLIADSPGGRYHYENEYYMTTVPTSLSHYTIHFKGLNNYWRYFVKEGGSISASKVQVRTNDNLVLPSQYYDLKVEKYLGFDAKKGEEMFEESSFPLKHGQKDSVDSEGNDMSGIAIYRVRAVAKEGSGYTGKTPKDEGTVVICSQKTLHSYASELDFGANNLRLAIDKPYARYEFIKGKKGTPKVVIGTKKLTKGKDYSIKYINLKTKASQSSFPKTEGKYICEIKGKGSYYGMSDNYGVKIGKKNPMKVKTKKMTVKFKTVKKKNVTIAPFKVTKAKGAVTYIEADKNSSKAVKYISVSDSTKGKLQVAKGTPKGTYKYKVNVFADGCNTNYVYGKKTVTVTVKVQ